MTRKNIEDLSDSELITIYEELKNFTDFLEKEMQGEE